MSFELTALMRHDTWELVPCSDSIKSVGCKWVFRVKHHPDGSINIFKALLVAKGYNQRLDLDYTNTFNPVVKPATIQPILTIVVMHGWSLQQMDVYNAFLHGDLFETIFMLQPPGFKDSTKPHHVCHLKKAIYGLKQAPKAWFTTFKAAITQLYFLQSKADPSLTNVIYSTDSHKCYCCNPILDSPIFS
jgi:hypothetical protein